MERKELKAYTGDHIYNVLEYAEFKDPCFDAEEFLIKAEADAVMDALEALKNSLEDENYQLTVDINKANNRIKELEQELTNYREDEKGYVED